MSLTLSPLEESFRPLGEVRGGLLLLPADAALRLVESARAGGVPVLGVDGFERAEACVRSRLDGILDLSAGGLPPADTWAEASRFIGERAGRGWLFEVVLGGSAVAEPGAAADGGGGKVSVGRWLFRPRRG